MYGIDTYISLDKCPNLNRKKLARWKNNKLFSIILHQFINQALRRYDIEGVPDTCDKRVILESLLFYNRTYLYEKNGGIISLPGGLDL